MKNKSKFSDLKRMCSSGMPIDEYVDSHPSMTLEEAATFYADEWMSRAEFSPLNDVSSKWYGAVLELSGVWASGKTETECRRELKTVVIDWALFRMAHGSDIPIPPWW